MIETLHPDVFTQERGLPPSIVGASTSTAGFVGTALKGPTDELGFVDGFRSFERLYGTNYPDSYLEDAVYMFFQNGGRRAYIGRAVGSGSAAATVNAPALETGTAAARIDSGNAELFDLEPADAISVSVDGGGAQTFTFTATRGTEAGSGLAIVDLTGLTLVIAIDGGGSQTVTFAGTETTVALVAQAINAQIVGGFATVNGAEVDISSDTRGTGSSVEVVSGTALTEIGHAAGTTTGTGDAVNIDAVTAAEVVTLMSGLAGATASDASGVVRLTHDTAGLASTLEVTAAAAAFNFPAGAVAGSDAAGVDLFQVDALTVGAHGDGIAITTERWRSATSAILATSGTSIALTDVARAEVGDVVLIDDGTTSVIAHVNAVNVSTKTISFAAVTLGSPIATGAVVTTASSHRARTELSAAALSTDLVITVASTSQIRVGTELSLDDGTTVIFRVVTKVNGSEVTLNGTVTAALAAGTPVVTQHFDMQVSVDNRIEEVFTYLSLQDTDTKDWVELRLAGDSNESAHIELIDLNPVIGTDLTNRPAASLNLALSGGQDGAVPGDNDYIGTSTPPTGLQLFDALTSGEVNILAIPGITTVAVQQALADFASAKQDMIALIDPPLSMDEPVEVRDWRLNTLNRDTSYAALYYPWLTVRDRHATASTGRKSVPPSGSIAGLYSRVDSDVGVWEAPGNKGLFQVIEPVVKISNGQQDLLNPVGVNVIRSFPGEGTRVWGIRTLANVADGRHYVHIRRLLNFDKISIAKALRRFIFAGIQPTLFSSIARAVESFHRTIWLQGGLFPNDNFADAQYVKVDEENNPPETRKLGQLFVDAGINPPFPAEFIIFRIGLFDGETTVDEVVG